MEDKLQFSSKQEMIEEMKIMFGEGVEDILEETLPDLGIDELDAVYELMILAYELGQAEA